MSLPSHLDIEEVREIKGPEMDKDAKTYYDDMVKRERSCLQK